MFYQHVNIDVNFAIVSKSICCLTNEVAYTHNTFTQWQHIPSTLQSFFSLVQKRRVSVYSRSKYCETKIVTKLNVIESFVSQYCAMKSFCDDENDEYDPVAAY
jgi:hypothetical protein